MLQNSLLKHVVVIDEFGRDYSADLTKAVHNTSFDITSFVMLDQTLGASSAPGTTETGLQAIASTTDTPQFGTVMMSGLVNTVTTPAIFSASADGRNIVQGYVSNMAMSVSPNEDVTFDVGYKLRLTGHVNEYDANASAAYSGLFLSASAVNSPYAALTDGGNYVGTTVRVADGLNVRTGFSWMNPSTPWAGPAASDLLARYQAQNSYDTTQQRDANSAMMSVSWNFADWGGLGVIASQTVEHNGVLGGTGSGALNVARSADTSAIDASMRIGLGKDWLATISYGEGQTRLNVQPDGLLDAASGLHSRTYGVAVATRNVFGNDTLGIALTRPLYVDSGVGSISAATGVDSSGNLTIGHSQLNFAESTPETDLEVGYTKSFLDGRLSLQSDAAYQMDVGGETGRNAVTFLTRLRWGL